jgi:murein DD-endopeptidase MepM/ murein hydrolase activator NlpD
MAANQQGRNGKPSAAASTQPRPFFRPRQLILRDGDQVHGIFLAPWLQKSVAWLLAIGLVWASAASLAVWYQTQQADEAAKAFRNAIADLSRQQMRIADISKGLEGQRATLGRLLAEGAERRLQAGEGPQPLPALEIEIAGLLGRIGELEGSLDGIRNSLDLAHADRQAIAREREAMADRLRLAERHAAERLRESERLAAERQHALEQQLAAVLQAQEDTLAGLQRRTNATVAEVERILSEAGLEPTRLLPTPPPPPPGAPAERPRRGRGGPFVPAALSLSAPPVLTPLQQSARGIDQQVDWLLRLARLLEATPVSVPLAGGYQVESGFGRRSDPIRNRAAMHTGIDLSDDHGTPVRATAPGKVTVAGWENGYGRVVEIDHGFGLRTRYAHLSSIAVEVDQQVGRFSKLGGMGSSGRSTGTHLHYEVLLHGQHMDPARFMQGAYTRHSPVSPASSSPTPSPGNGPGR